MSIDPEPAAAPPPSVNQYAPLTLPAIFGASACAVLWAGNPLAVKLASPSFPALRMAGWRFTLALLATGGAAWCLRRSLRLRSDQTKMVAIHGVLLFAQIGLFTIGTVWSSSAHSSILINVYPFFTAALSHVFLPQAKLRASKLMGMALAFAGVVTMFSQHLGLPSHASLAGDAVLLVSAAILGLKITYAKACLGRIAVLPLVFWEAALAALLFFATSALLNEPGRVVAPLGVAGLLYQSWAVSGLAFVGWMLLLERHAPNDITVFSFATPFLGMLLGHLVLAEPLTWQLVVGSLLTLSGIFQVTRAG